MHRTHLLLMTEQERLTQMELAGLETKSEKSIDADEPTASLSLNRGGEGV